MDLVVDNQVVPVLVVIGHLTIHHQMIAVVHMTQVARMIQEVQILHLGKNKL